MKSLGATVRRARRRALVVHLPRQPAARARPAGARSRKALANTPSTRRSSRRSNCWSPMSGTLTRAPRLGAAGIRLPDPSTRASGGIGRRAGFRFLCPKGCGGSSPPSPTPPEQRERPAEDSVKQSQCLSKRLADATTRAAAVRRTGQRRLPSDRRHLGLRPRRGHDGRWLTRRPEIVALGMRGSSLTNTPADIWSDLEAGFCFRRVAWSSADIGRRCGNWLPTACKSSTARSPDMTDKLISGCGHRQQLLDRLGTERGCPRRREGRVPASRTVR